MTENIKMHFKQEAILKDDNKELHGDVMPRAIMAQQAELHIMLSGCFQKIKERFKQCLK
jgi:hypothetical protein